MTIHGQKGARITEEEEFYLQWGLETLRANVDLVNDILKQLLTLSAALIGSGVFFLTKDIVPNNFIAPILILFVISLILSLLGLLPYVADIDINSPSGIKQYKNQVFKSKLIFVRFSAALLIIGLIASGLGVIIKYRQDSCAVEMHR